MTQKKVTKEVEQAPVQNNNPELYKLGANKLLMILFLINMICFVVLVLLGFVDIDFDSSFPSVMSKMAISFLPCLYILLHGLRKRKNDYAKSNNNVVHTFLAAIPLTILSTYCWAMCEGSKELFLKYDHPYWFASIGAMMIGNYGALVIIGLLNVALDRNKKLNILSLILSTLGYLVLVVGLPVLVVLVTGNL